MQEPPGGHWCCGWPREDSEGLTVGETMVRSIWGALGSGRSLASGQSRGLSRDDPATVGDVRQRLGVPGRQEPWVLSFPCAGVREGAHRSQRAGWPPPQRVVAPGSAVPNGERLI